MRLTVFILLILLWTGSALAGEGKRPPKPTEQPGKEDLKIIAVMDILQMMDLIQNIDIIKDMDVLVEENRNESQD